MCLPAQTWRICSQVGALEGGGIRSEHRQANQEEEKEAAGPSWRGCASAAAPFLKSSGVDSRAAADFGDKKVALQRSHHSVSQQSQLPGQQQAGSGGVSFDALMRRRLPKSPASSH